MIDTHLEHLSEEAGAEEVSLDEVCRSEDALVLRRYPERLGAGQGVRLTAVRATAAVTQTHTPVRSTAARR